MEQVRGRGWPAAASGAPLRRGSYAQVDPGRLDRVPPRRSGPRQPVRGVIGGMALHLPQQPVLAGQVKEAGVPPVRQDGVLSESPGSRRSRPGRGGAHRCPGAPPARCPALQHPVRRGGDRLNRYFWSANRTTNRTESTPDNPIRAIRRHYAWSSWWSGAGFELPEPSADTKLGALRARVGAGGVCAVGWGAGRRPGGRSGIRPGPSGSLRWGDGDDAAGVEFLEVADQVVLPGLGVPRLA